MAELLRRRPGLVAAAVVVLLAAGVLALRSGGGAGDDSGGVRTATSTTTAKPKGSTTTSTSTSTTKSTPSTTTAVAPDVTAPPATAAPGTTGPFDTAPPATLSPITEPPPAGGIDTGAASQIISFMNGQRAAKGVGALSANGCLTGLAQGWAETMGNRQAMVHNPGYGACSSTAAENIGMWQPCSTAAIDAWWVGSPGHYANIVNGAYATVGVGVWADGSGSCWYVVDFGP